jgi:predicted Zn-dependent protease
MSAPGSTADAAFRVAEKVRAPGPWEVYAERTRGYEIHLNGTVVELTRGPIIVEGYGIRLLRPHGEKTGTGFQASVDFSDAGIKAVVDDAEVVARHSEFPAKNVTLPSNAASGKESPEILDATLWSKPTETLQGMVQALVEGFLGRTNEVLSFGSVRASLVETSIANSNGLRASYPHTLVEYEAAVKASGGPEGPAPGEYWVNDSARRVDTTKFAAEIADWCRYAQDVRRASAPPTGELPVVLPPSVLSTILPIVFGSRFTGGSRIRGIAVESGATVGGADVNISDDGRFPWGFGSAPFDDEGTPQRRRTLIRNGRVEELLYDSLRGAAFGTPSSGNALRSSAFGLRDPRRFTHSPLEGVTTLAIEPGKDGGVDELAESAGDGILVQQIGWAFPDPVSSSFGGEIRVGYRIRGGKLAEPVRGGTVGGVVIAPPGAHSLLADVAAIGSETTLFDQVATPPLLVRPLVVAGA